MPLTAQATGLPSATTPAATGLPNQKSFDDLYGLLSKLGTKDDLTVIQLSVKTLYDTVEKGVKQTEELINTLTDHKKEIDILSSTVEHLQEGNLAKDERIRTLESKFEQIETERRKRNVIIHGIKEQRTDIRSVFDELCGALEVDLRARDCGYISRMGQIQNNQKHPRPITVELGFPPFKGEIYRSISRLKELPKLQGVTISDDLSPESARKKNKTWEQY